jgi:hypothetical protein
VVWRLPLCALWIVEINPKAGSEKERCDYMEAIAEPITETSELEAKVPRGRKPKAVKPPTRLERAEKVRQRIVGLAEELMTDGFGDLLSPPGAVQLSETPDGDPKTGGYIGKVKEPLGIYLQRVSVVDNYSQRPPFDHVNDSIYRRLIRDFIEGAAMPEAKVAALNRSASTQKAASLEDTSDIRFSVIDGLQRLYCFCLALLIVFRREQLVADGLLPEEAWEYFADAVAAKGDPRAATEELLKRPVRYEVFFNIDLAGLLHYALYGDLQYRAAPNESPGATGNHAEAAH